MTAANAIELACGNREHASDHRPTRELNAKVTPAGIISVVPGPGQRSLSTVLTPTLGGNPTTRTSTGAIESKAFDTGRSEHDVGSRSTDHRPHGQSRPPRSYHYWNQGR